MAFTKYHFFLAALMLITGTINTLSTKWADRQKARFCNRSDNNTYDFNHPFLQAVGMFLGEILCLLAFKFMWYSTARYRLEKDSSSENSSRIATIWPIQIKKEIHMLDGSQKFNPLIFWVASICDMTSTCLSYFALNLTTASTFQMLRGSVMVFTAIFSFLLLRRKIPLIKCFGILVIVAGLAIVGSIGFIYPDKSADSHSAGQQIAGVSLILLGMIFTSLQVVYEERFIGRYNIPPLQAVGWEGIFGFFTLGVVLIPFHFIHLSGSGTGPDEHLEDIKTAFCQMGDNGIIVLATVGNIFSIAFFNFAGISVTKELSSTTRMVLDSGRTVLIWVVSLALKWENFQWLQVIGFLLLLTGVGIYNDVWIGIYKALKNRGNPPSDQVGFYNSSYNNDRDKSFTSTGKSNINDE